MELEGSLFTCVNVSIFILCRLKWALLEDCLG